MKPSKVLSAYLNADAEFEGNLVFSGTLEINGSFKGDIAAAGTLVAGKEANIEADIHVDTVLLSGKIVGDVKADKRIEIMPSGRLFGDIQAPTIVIHAGALFEGRCLTQAVAVNRSDDVKLLSGSRVQKMKT